MKKSSIDSQQSVDINATSESDDKYLVAEFRKENERLHKLIAKKQVAHESEINKIRAEHAEELAKAITPNISVSFVSSNTLKTPGDDV